MPTRRCSSAGRFQRTLATYDLRGWEPDPLGRNASTATLAIQLTWSAYRLTMASLLRRNREVAGLQRSFPVCDTCTGTIVDCETDDVGDVAARRG